MLRRNSMCHRVPIIDSVPSSLSAKPTSRSVKASTLQIDDASHPVSSAGGEEANVESSHKSPHSAFVAPRTRPVTQVLRISRVSGRCSRLSCRERERFFGWSGGFDLSDMSETRAREGCLVHILDCVDKGSRQVFQPLLCNCHPWSSNFFFLVTKVNNVGIRAKVAFVRHSGRFVVNDTGCGSGSVQAWSGSGFIECEGQAAFAVV